MSLTDLLTRQETMENYVNKDKELARELFKAGKDASLIRQALIKKSEEEFIVNVFKDPKYEPFLLSVAESAMMEHPEVEEELAYEQLGLKPPKKKKVMFRKKPKVKKTITSKTKTGKTYKRSFNRWSSSEEQFIKTRLRNDKSVGDISKEFFDQTDYVRTESSVKTKIYRIKGEMKDV